MARTALLKGILDRVGVKPAKKADAWSVVKIEKMLAGLDIKRHEINYEAKAVHLTSKADLIEVLYHLMPSVSEGYQLALNEMGGKARLKIGGWQFEADV